MRKTLRFFMLSLLTLFCGTMMAEEVTIDFNNDVATLFPTITSYSSGSGASYVPDGEFQETTTSVAVGGVTVTVSASPADANNRNRLWASNPRLRMYDGTITFTSAGEKITKMVITRSTNGSKIANQNTVDSGELTTSDQQSNGEVTWTGEAQSVTMTIAGNTQFSKVVLTLGEGGGGETPPTPQVEQVTVAQALAIIDGLADGATTAEEYQVKGYVVGAPDFQRNASGVLYGNVNLTIADQKGGTDLLTVFRAKNFKSVSFTEADLESIKEGDEVVFQGNLQKFVKNEVTTPELTNGYLVSVNGKTEGDTPTEMTEAANIAAFKALEVGKAAKLTLANAQVLFASGKDIFVRDASGAVDFYDTGLTLTTGQIVNGSVVGQLAVYNGMPELTKTADTNADNLSTAEGTATPRDIGIDEVSGFECDLVILKGITLVQEEGNWYATNEDNDRVQVFDKFKIGYTPEAGKTYDVTGIVVPYKETFEIAPIDDFTGGVVIPATSVPSIAALLGMENTPNVELTLNNAKVLFVDGNNYVYVRENGKALCFYQINGLKDQVKNNSVINGKIQVDYEVYKLLPEVKSNKNTNLDNLAFEESEEKAEPVATTLAQVAAGENVCDLVTVTATLIREVTYKEDGETVNTTTYYLQDGDTKIVAVNNGKGLNKLADNAVEQVTVTGIVNTSNNAYQIKLTETAVDPSGINDVRMDTTNPTIFNLAGQRVEKAQKGLYIIGGKKVVKK